MANFCGGIQLSDNFTIVNGIITLVENEDPIDTTVTPCGQLFDGNIFDVYVIDTKHKVLTAVGVDHAIPMPQPIKSNCGIYLDSRFFTVENKTVDFVERHLLEVLVSPPEVEYTISVTHEGEPVEPFAGTTVYPMDILDGEYVVTVDAEGYNQGTDTVTADSDQIVTITLTPA